MIDLGSFVDAVGTDGAVTCVGGRTQWDVGGLPPGGVREVHAPSGVHAFVPEEMTVECGAGTPIDVLQAALAEHGQSVALPSWPGATVGGVLAVGRSGVTRLGHGPVRDTLLQARLVMADGAVVKAGGPTVKNVTGYDLCRLVVGSLGTLGLIADVVLRTRPLPSVSQWFRGEADPFELAARLYRPTALLWDGATVWLCLEGHGVDVAAQAAISGLTPVDGPPSLPPHRESVAPGRLRELEGRFVAEVGVGVVHRALPVPPSPSDPAVVVLHKRLKLLFDPRGRLNPGRSPLAGS
ncbi:MAG: FAD-binding protein [Acidimicrobiia bacterium]